MKITKKDYDDCADLEEIRWTFIDKHAQEESFIHRDKTSITACIQAEYGSGICIPGSQIEVSYSRNFSDREKIEVSYEIFSGDGEERYGGIGFDHELKGITFSQLQAADDNTIMNLSKTLFGDFKWEIKRFLDGDKQQLIIEKMDINDLDFDGEFPPVSKNFEVKNGVLVKYKGNEKEVQIPSYITSIGDYAFKDCNSLKKITVPESIKKIGDGVFMNCRNLEEAHLPQCDKGKAIFEGCSNLNHFSYYGKVTERMFYGSGIKRATINSEKCEVEDLAYVNCKNLEEFRIRKATDIKIAKSAFEGCPNVTFKCYKDSPAEEYFKKNNYRYEYLEAEKEQSKTKGDKVMDEKKRKTNSDKLKEISDKKPPLIFVDVETTGIMNGNDNHITQLAMTAYDFNRSTGRYELQDNIFLLAKAHPDTLHGIEVKGAPTKENASRLLKNEYIDAYRQEIARGYTNISNRIKTLEKKIEKREEQIENCTSRQIKKKEGYETDLARYKKNLAVEQTTLAEFQKLRSLVFDENDKPINFDDKPEQDINKLVESIRNDAFIKERGDIYPTGEVIAGSHTFKNDKQAKDNNLTVFKNVSCYIDSRLDDKIKTLKNESLDNVLSVQGIDKGKWIKEGLGLTTGEMQIGINEFLKKYDSDSSRPATYVTNGTHYTTHYLTKDALSIFDATKRNVFDIYQHEKWQSESENKWTANVGTFAKIYEQRTGKTIKTFDAFTKALCYAEMTKEITNIPFSNSSVNQLANAVVGKVSSMDKDYVMSAARASALNWKVTSQYNFEHSDYKFNSLDYVDFGTTRKYVDIDTLFEINDNFEVTLEGEKEPIKNWNELENKIKALNANISEDLLEQIKFKYEEIEKNAEEQKTLYQESIGQPNDKLVYADKGEEATVPKEKESASTSDLAETLSNILSDFETQYEKATAEMNEAQAEFEEIKNNTDLAKGLKADLTAIGNFVKGVISKGVKGNNSDNGLVLSKYQNIIEVSLRDNSFSSLKADKYRLDIQFVYMANNNLNNIDFICINQYQTNDCSFKMRLNAQDNSIEFTDGKEPVFVEIMEKWDDLKNRIINGCQAKLTEKILTQKEKTQHIKEDIRKIKKLEK